MKVFFKLALRLMAVYAAVKAIPHIQNAVVICINGMDKTTPGLLEGTLLTLVLYLAAAAILWIFAERLSVLACGGRQDIAVLDKLDARLISRVAIGIAGMVILVNALPDLIGDIVNYCMSTGTAPMPEKTLISIKVSLIAESVKVILSVLMILGSKALVSLLKWTRDAGISGN